MRKGEYESVWTIKTKTARTLRSQRDRERLKDWASREETEAEGLVWQKGKGGGHEAAVERELRPGKRVTFKSSREPLESLSPCGSKQIDMNQKNKFYFVLC